MRRLKETPGTVTHTVWRIQHFNDPKTTTKGYEGWQWSNQDCFPRVAYSSTCDGWQRTGMHGFLTVEIGLAMLEIVRTTKVVHHIDRNKHADQPAFGDRPLRLVKYTFTETMEIERWCGCHLQNGAVCGSYTSRNIPICDRCGHEDMCHQPNMGFIGQ